MSVTFSVPFVHGLQRHQTTRGGHAYDTRRNREDKQDIAVRYRIACGKATRMRPELAPRGVPVAVDVTIARALPRSVPSRVAVEPDTHKPDADNVLKLVLDALNGVAYEDDAQVVQACVRKMPRRRLVDDHMTVTVRRIDWGD